MKHGYICSFHSNGGCWELFPSTWNIRRKWPVRSKMLCRELHSELFGCRHSTLQSHGLFALAKQLFSLKLLVYSVVSYCASETLIRAQLTLNMRWCVVTLRSWGLARYRAWLSGFHPLISPPVPRGKLILSLVLVRNFHFCHEQDYLTVRNNLNLVSIVTRHILSQGAMLVMYWVMLTALQQQATQHWD